MVRPVRALSYGPDPVQTYGISYRHTLGELIKLDVGVGVGVGVDVAPQIFEAVE